MDDTRTVETPDAPETDQHHGGRVSRMFWSKTSAVLSAVLVVVLVGCVIWLATTRPSTAPAQPAPAPHHAVALAHGCGPAASPDQLPPSTPPATTWKLLGSMAAPTSPAVGPADSADGVPTCFAPDPTGALFAAATFVAATSDPQLRTAVLQQLAVDNDGRTVALDEVATRPGGATVGVQTAGFTFLSYDAHARTATVDLALTAQGGFVHVPIQLAWTDDDWKVVLPITGRLYDHLTVIPDLNGYVPWQGA